MPTYVYRCEDCQEEIEVIQKFSDAPLSTCPHCGGSLKRLLFPPSIIFKGSGWYVKDHGRPTSGNGSSSKRKEEPAAEGDAAVSTADPKAKRPAEKNPE
ncbi:MAG: hypothetical protein JXA37_13465 [Chloroflexia bacterium]|nr:hypothetical protein [Chloroflexia bacterium]